MNDIEAEADDGNGYDDGFAGVEVDWIRKGGELRRESVSFSARAYHELWMRRIVLEESPEVGIEINRMPLRLLTASDHLEDVTQSGRSPFSVLQYISDTFSH